MAVTKNRRKNTRMGISLPTMVAGHDLEGPWEEMTASEDASFGGASFLLRHPVQAGHVLRLQLPLPKAFRQHALNEPSYPVFALVRHVADAKGGQRVGVMFLGKSPPQGYESNPGGRYLLPTDPKPAPKDRRQQRRFDMIVNVRIERTEEGTHGVREERTIVENLSRGGARVLTSLAVTKGEVLLLEELGGSFRARAEIRNVYIGKDNVPRLNLRFLDAAPPERLVPEA